MSKHRHKHNQQNKNADHQSNPGNQNGQNNPAVTHVMGEVETHPSPASVEKHDAERREDTAHEGKKFLVERITLFVLALYTVITLYNAWLTRDIANINRESLESVQRAFMVFDAIHYEPVTDPTQGGEIAWVFRSQWSNLGTTPARVVGTHFAVAKLPAQPEGREFIGDEQVNGGIGSLIGPKSPVRSSGIKVPAMFHVPPKGLEPDGSYELERGPQVFLWGWVVYRDIFPNTPPHITEFCTRISKGYVDVGKTYPARFSFDLCTQHNCDDENCKDYKQIVGDIFRLPVKARN